ncbi:MAG: malate dehydrogenase [Elusimicrobia bacterium GWF2_52_66]|nr:MAG: malate dehydrogenase [Elusimicrobia bacterium GWA2_51_34]OGR85443.1 MAG: malate dehydrogenase [Elusimicrobia bacterium GWF2_52_66]HAF94942.1 malate dehydrogenase [Elusimicrobiota bacterium]HCE97484.1 malate dehydrogenase [Elusimicrobiota bacterium]
MSKTTEKMSKEELLKKANKPSQDAMKMHPFYKGKIEVLPKCCVRNVDDFAIWYTPGVAAVCKDIEKNPEMVYEHTNKGNMVAVVSDGTRVLGLGDIGPEAGLPVMEGKSLLFKYLGGVDSFPICLNTKDPDEIIKTVQYLAPSFGGINLEDISQPKCFYILDELRKTMNIPVWHDDQQGTATVCLAGLINALKIVGKKIQDVKIVLVGAGAANIRIGTLYMSYGAKPENLIYVDSKGTLHKDRADLKNQKEKWHMCEITNGSQIKGGAKEALAGADVLSAASTPGPDTIKKEWVAGMNKDSIVFATANPIPEIWPWDAKEAGARVVATGRSDFENQVNNSLGFPGIFRGVLDVRAKTITDEMCIAAAEALAGYAARKGLRADYIMPRMDEPEVFVEEAVAVGMMAIKQGVARKIMSEAELRKAAEFAIKRAIRDTEIRQKEGIVKMP